MARPTVYSLAVLSQWKVVRIYYPSRRTVYSHLFVGRGVQCGFTGHVNDKAQALEQQRPHWGKIG